MGYADCHPWPELGDLPLDRQLKEWTPLTSQSLRFARIDAEARATGTNLLEGLPIPPSHYLVISLQNLEGGLLEILMSQGFTHLKIKVGQQVPEEILQLKTLMGSHVGQRFRWRLDFNGRLSVDQFAEFLDAMKDFLHLIDFIEDPCPYQTDTWASIQSHYGISLACDRWALEALGSPAAASVIILKPAIHHEDLFQNHKQRLVVTSYLDHPLGQACAAYIAGKLALTEVCGLLSHTAYEATPFSSRLSTGTPHFHPIPGTGFGFDEILPC